VFARCGKILVVIALVLTTGLHWAALQTVAWTTMLAANLTSESLSASVSDTFDGKHCCPLCRAIAAAKSTEKKSDVAPLKLKFEYPPLAERFALIAPAAFEHYMADKFSFDSRSSEPALPPPRVLFA
jgi:hypothetical protein